MKCLCGYTRMGPPHNRYLAPYAANQLRQDRAANYAH